MQATNLRETAAPGFDIPSMLRQGLELFGTGRLSEAEFAFTAVLAIDQSCFEALQCLAIVRLRQGRAPEALDLINRALRQRPDAAEALALQGTLLSRLDRDGEALVSFDRFLATHPEHVETLYNRGVALAKLGRTGEAAASYGAVLALRPGHAPALFNLSNAFAKLQHYDQALAGYDLLLARAGANADVLNNRGNVLFEMQRYADALADYDRGLALRADHAELLRNRGRALKALGRLEQAVESYERLLALAPCDVGALNERGRALIELGRPLEALASFEQALAVAPADLPAHNSRCAALQKLGRFEDALSGADSALAIDPANAEAHFSRGNALSALNRFEPAVESYRTSLALGPGIANVHKNLASALHVLDRHEEALSHYDHALALGARDAETTASKSLVYLTLGRFAEGWEPYESRFGADRTAPRRDYPQPRWTGERIDGTLLVWGEQGLGDQILYASMLPDLAGRAAKVVVEVEPRLVDLFARSFRQTHVIAIASELYAGEMAAHTPIGGLGRYLRPDWQSFPRRAAGFLVPDESRARALRARLKGDGRTIVGLSWKSQNPRFEKAKSARLLDFESLLLKPGCRFVDLQYGDTQADREAVERALGVRVEHLDEIDNTKDIDGLAALIAACDKVVTVSNTTAHLAGALGRPTVVLVPYGHARLWYWFKDLDDSPWYPRLRVKRQRSGQSWGDLIALHADEIL